MERLLDSILTQARPNPQPSEAQQRAAIGGVLESVGRLLEKRAHEKQLKLVVDIGADLPSAAIDEDALRQIVLNLALNAFEVTPEAGGVRLTVARASEPLGLVLTVDDEGPGVPKPDRERLFEPFFSTRTGGPGGLGLTVCRRLVEGAGGSIHVESAPNQSGARFCVRLPAAG
jgi:signal transduction histidine kinase